jgi:predicted permease
MTVLFSVIAPIFGLIVMGAASTGRRWLDSHVIKGMNDFTFFAAMPALLFRSVVEAPPLKLIAVAGPFLIGAVLLFVVALLLSRWLFKGSLAESGIAGLDGIYGNTVMLGIPVVDALYGAPGVANLLAIIAVHSAVLLPIGTVVIEADAGTGRSMLHVVRASLSGTARNPIVMAIVLAFLWRATGLGLAAPLDRLMEMLGRAGPPLALFCLGATLPRPRGMTGFGEVMLSSALTLLALPALVGLLAYLAGVRGVAFDVVVLAAAMPTGANAFLLARRYEVRMEESATTVAVSTALSVVTLTVLLAWLG